MRPGILVVVLDVMDAVPALLRQAAAEAVLPVFGMREARPEEKSPGEWVTTADRAAEALLAPQLAALVPGSVVVGEEAASADPAVLDQLLTAADVWLLDPLDGTANFAAGEAPFAVMAALLRHGDTVASWMLDPLSGRIAAAERGGGHGWTASVCRLVGSMRTRQRCGAPSFAGSCRPTSCRRLRQSSPGLRPSPRAAGALVTTTRWW